MGGYSGKEARLGVVSRELIRETMSEPAEIVEIPGLTGRFVEVAARYDYAVDKNRCAVCGGLGFPWGGWFSCESDYHYSLVNGGRSFLRISPLGESR